MKKILFSLLVCLMLASVVEAQIRKIPADVTSALKTKFPTAKDVEWKDKLTFFQANFKQGSDDMTVNFSPKGEWQQTEKALTYDATPSAVKDGFKKSKYSSPDDWKIGDVVTQITKSDNSIQYRIYVDKVGGIQKKYLYFDPSGQLQKEALTL